MSSTLHLAPENPTLVDWTHNILYHQSTVERIAIFEAPYQQSILTPVQ